MTSKPSDAPNLDALDDALTQTDKVMLQETLIRLAQGCLEKLPDDKTPCWMDKIPSALHCMFSGTEEAALLHLHGAANAFIDTASYRTLRQEHPEIRILSLLAVHLIRSPEELVKNLLSFIRLSNGFTPDGTMPEEGNHSPNMQQPRERVVPDDIAYGTQEPYGNIASGCGLYRQK